MAANQTRNQEFDILRTVIILNACLLHFHSRYNLSYIAGISTFWQNHIFSVGTFFFFTSGFMARLFYLKKFRSTPGKTTLKLFLKGFEVLAIYILYVTLMRLATGSSIPLNPYEFIYSHSFFTKVLFAFAAMYIVSPAIIYGYMKAPSAFYGFLGLMLVGLIAYNQYDFPYFQDTMAIGFLFGVGAKKVFYAFIPTLIIYQFGFIAGAFGNSSPLDQIDLETRLKNIRKLAIRAALVISGHIVLSLISGRYASISTRPIIFIILSSILVFLSILVVRGALSYEKFSQFINSRELTVVGIESLMFYVGSNLLLSFTKLPGDASLLYKLIILLAIMNITAKIVQWHHQSKAYIRILRTPE